MLLSSAAIGLPYLHHAFSRAEPQHLFQSAAPLIVLGVTYAVQAWRSGFRRIAAGIVAASIVLTSVLAIPHQGLFNYATSPGAFQEVTAGSDTLLLGPTARSRLAFIETLGEAVGDDSLLVTGIMPTIYALLNKRSPIYNTYMSWPEPPARQQQMIEDLNNNDTRWALITSVRKLRQRDPILLRHIQTWEKVDLEGMPRGSAVYRRPPTAAP